MRPAAWIVLATSVAALAVGALTGGAATGRALARCHTSDLSGRFGFIQGAAGSRFGPLLLTNRSARACTLFGYMGGQLYSASGRKIPTRFVRDHSVTPRVVTVAPRRSARAVLRWSAIPSGSGSCPRPGFITVTPPDERTQLHVRWTDGHVCGSGRIDVRPVTR